MSSRLLDAVFDNGDLDVEWDDVRLISDLIQGSYNGGEGWHQDIGWTFDIVNNKRNSLDVDKYDYLVRDASSVGMDVAVNPMKLVDAAHVIGD